MIYSLIRSKRFLIAVGIIIFLTAVLVVFSVLQSIKSDVSIEKTSTELSDSSSKKVSLSIDYTPTTNLTPDIQSEFSSQLANFIESNKAKPGSYRAAVRAGTFTDTVVEGTPVQTMIIDIPDLRSSYTAYKVNGGPNGQNTLEVHCTPQERQRDPSWRCNEIAH